jgi:hypothetical protein
MPTTNAFGSFVTGFGNPFSAKLTPTSRARTKRWGFCQYWQPIRYRGDSEIEKKEKKVPFIFLYARGVGDGNQNILP